MAWTYRRVQEEQKLINLRGRSARRKSQIDSLSERFASLKH